MGRLEFCPKEFGRDLEKFELLYEIYWNCLDFVPSSTVCSIHLHESLALVCILMNGGVWLKNRLSRAKCQA